MDTKEGRKDGKKLIK